MNISAAAAAAGAVAAGHRPSFTASQWQELEHQALIFKYLVAGIPVPPELLLPIRRSLESTATRFYHPPMGYCSFYGKKLDPEPGRCRRTDGKKWRCSKEAYPDSKYCERHMHRGRNRSRKPVETQLLSQSQSSLSSSSSSTMTSLVPSGSGVTAGSGGGGGRFPSGIPLRSLVAAGSSSAAQVALTGSTFNQLQMDLGTCGMASRDYRYPRDARNEVDGHCFFFEASGNAKGMGFNSSLDSDPRLMPPQVPSYSFPKSRNDSLLVGSYAQLQSVQGFERAGISSSPNQQQQQQQQQHLYDSHFNSSEIVKNPLRPFFDELPKTRGSWPDLEDGRSKRTLFSTTQLSISLPLSSDFTTSSRSPSGVP
ncbi:hypothetical protein Taro_009781 [Colocasia esculenta]|uniref:Growth-regulating factor n=1 Tax=Colocasia esculenta TaxID=4460 RepID=A0A843U1T8_COLES|nr:hypothetical protein [Colocasia esculenta]